MRFHVLVQGFGLLAVVFGQVLFLFDKGQALPVKKIIIGHSHQLVGSMATNDIRLRVGRFDVKMMLDEDFCFAFADNLGKTLQGFSAIAEAVGRSEFLRLVGNRERYMPEVPVVDYFFLSIIQDFQGLLYQKACQKTRAKSLKNCP